MLVIALLLALMPALTSCENHELDDPSVEEDALREYYYNQKFESMFGTIDPQHDWGFGVDTSLSRAVNVNGNEWVAAPSVEYEEIILTWAYLMYCNDIQSVDIPIFENFYLTQVFSSHDLYTAQDGTQNIDGSSEMNYLHVAMTQSAEDGYVNGEIYPGNNDSGWEHSNNFNASNNVNYNGNSLHTNSGTYDFVYYNSRGSKYYNTFIGISGFNVLEWAATANWSTIIPALSQIWNQKVTAGKFDSWTESVRNGLTAAFTTFDWNKVTQSFKDSFAQYYYICFDYEALFDEYYSEYQSVKGTISYYAPERDGENNIVYETDSEGDPIYEVDADGNYILDSENNKIQKIKYSTTVSTYQLNGINATFKGAFATLSEVTTEAITEGIEYYISLNKSSFSEINVQYSNIISIELTEGSLNKYVNARSGNQDDGSKWVIGDDIYTDWVVRLIGPAIRKDEYWRRVLVEDLSVAAGLNLNNNASDWDFNDVVMDIKITIGTNVGEDKAEIKLRALGGTLPVYIGYDTKVENTQKAVYLSGLTTETINQGQSDESTINVGTTSESLAETGELHNLFGESSSSMINTGAGPDADPITFTLTGYFSVAVPGTNDRAADYNYVRVYVDNGTLTELKSEVGKAPSKICVGSDFKWCKEYINITVPYPAFYYWVNDRTYTEGDANSYSPWYYENLIYSDATKVMSR